MPDIRKWDLIGPHARVGFQCPGEVEIQFSRALEEIPGVRLRRGFWLVPYHALDVVQSVCDSHGAKPVTCTWTQSPPSVPEWEVVEKELGNSPFRDEYLGEFPRPHQKTAICRGWNSSGIHLWHSTGAGKSYSGIALSIAHPGPTLVITRSAVRFQFAREIERFVDTRTFVIRAESQLKKRMTVDGLTWREFFKARMPELGKVALVAEEWARLKEDFGVEVEFKSKSLPEYIDDCAQKGKKAYVVVGWEALVDHLPKLEKIPFETLVLDELHAGKGSKRWEVIYLPPLPDDPKKAAEIRKEEKEEADSKGGFIREDREHGEDGPLIRKMLLPVMNRAAAAARLSRMRSVQLRIGLTATPISDRVRDLWGQLDTIEPNCWGSTSSFKKRHCDLKPGKYGGMDSTGSSNLPELKNRLSYISHVVPAQEAHAHLLHLKRRQSVYVSAEDQVRPTTGFGAELKAVKSKGGTSLLEVRLAQAASRKRKAVIDMIDDHIGSGHKAVVFTARKRDCEDLGKRLSKARMGKKVKPTIWVAHGGMSGAMRQEVVDEYMAHPGPCVLVGTGQAFGTGLSLNDTDAAFFVMLPYTPGALRQWEGRFLRQDSTRAILIYYVIAEGTVDEHVASILIDKLPAVEDIADDKELGESRDFLAGMDKYKDNEEAFAEDVLSMLDFDV